MKLNRPPDVGDKVKFREEFLEYHMNIHGPNIISCINIILEVESVEFKEFENLYKVCFKDFTYTSSSNQIYNYLYVRSDGTFGSSEIILLDLVDSVSSIAPRNNDGRAVCFWCNISTQKRGNGMYDVCPKCGR